MSANTEFPGMGGANTRHLCWRMGPDTQLLSFELVEVDDSPTWDAPERSEAPDDAMEEDRHGDDSPWPPEGNQTRLRGDSEVHETPLAGSGDEDKSETAPDDEEEERG